MTEKVPFIREVKEYSLVSTHGDFITTSKDFVRIPGTVLPLTIEQTGYFHIYISLKVSGDGDCAVALMVDGQLIVSGRLYMKYYPLERIAMTMTTQLLLAPGSHILEIHARALEGDYAIPEGPREWSPRKNKKLPKKAIIHASPDDPVVLRMIG